MFEDLCDEYDLEWTEHRLRVEVMSLKKAEKVEELFRLYGVLAGVLARRGNHLKAQDALNDAEFLLVEHGWRGTPLEAWCHLDRGKVFLALGRPKLAQSNFLRAQELLKGHQDEELEKAVELALASASEA